MHTSPIRPIRPRSLHVLLRASLASLGLLACASEPTTQDASQTRTDATAGRAADSVALTTEELAAAPVTVTLTFDDQRASQIQVRDALKANGRNFKATFYLMSSEINDQPGEPAGNHPQSLSVAQLKQLAADGNELGGHTRTHADLATLSAAQQRDEICGGRNELLALGLGSNQQFVSFAYPYGNHNAAIESVVASCGFTNARTVAAGPETIPPANAFATRTNSRGSSITNADTLATVKSWVTGAPAGRWVQLVYHDIASPQFTPVDQYSQSLADFNAFLDFLQAEQAAGRVVVKTVAEVIGGTACVPTTCAAQGKNCGSISDGCGNTLSCGTCSGNQTCSASNVCTSSASGTCSLSVATNTYVGSPSYVGTLALRNTGTAAWTAPTVRFDLPSSSNVCDDAEIIPGAGWSLSSSAGRCTYSRTSNLAVAPGATLSLKYSSNYNGSSPAVAPTVSDAACGGTNTCTPESDASFCARLAKNCGNVSGTDNCGKARTVSSCGSCTAPATCGGAGVANVCGSVSSGACSYTVTTNSYVGSPSYHGTLALRNTGTGTWTTPTISFDLPSSGNVCDDANIIPGAGWTLQSSAGHCVYKRGAPSLSVAPGATLTLEYSSNNPQTPTGAAASGVSVAGCSP